jgi:2-dehydro-3-deoxygalactonokinase
MSLWRLCGHDGAEGRAMALDGARILTQAVGSSAEAALAALGDANGPVLNIGEGAETPLPAPVLPEAGTGLPPLGQKTPPDRIDGWARLLLIGLTEAQPDWDGVACLTMPDLVHWVHLSAREAVSCQSFLTPRLVTALGGTPEADAEALTDSLSRPERLAAHLRAAEIRGAPAALTGHLLGAELAAARPYWLGQSVALIGAGAALAGRAAALEAQAVPITCHAPDALLAPALAALARLTG